jgi:hypothetical protein
MIKVIPIRDGRPPLTDIPGRLRSLADNIEAGHNGDISSVIILMPVEGDYPRVLQYGQIEGQTNEPMIQFQLALHWFCANLVIRQ